MTTSNAPREGQRVLEVADAERCAGDAFPSDVHEGRRRRRGRTRRAAPSGEQQGEAATAADVQEFRALTHPGRVQDGLVEGRARRLVVVRPVTGSRGPQLCLFLADSHGRAPFPVSVTGHRPQATRVTTSVGPRIRARSQGSPGGGPRSSVASWVRDRAPVLRSRLSMCFSTVRCETSGGTRCPGWTVRRTRSRTSVSRGVTPSVETAARGCGEEGVTALRERLEAGAERLGGRGEPAPRFAPAVGQRGPAASIRARSDHTGKCASSARPGPGAQRRRLPRSAGRRAPLRHQQHAAVRAVDRHAGAARGDRIAAWGSACTASSSGQRPSRCRAGVRRGEALDRASRLGGRAVPSSARSAAIPRPPHTDPSISSPRGRPRGPGCCSAPSPRRRGAARSSARNANAVARSWARRRRSAAASANEACRSPRPARSGTDTRPPAGCPGRRRC